MKLIIVEVLQPENWDEIVGACLRRAQRPQNLGGSQTTPLRIVNQALCEYNNG